MNCAPTNEPCLDFALQRLLEVKVLDGGSKFDSVGNFFNFEIFLRSHVLVLVVAVQDMLFIFVRFMQQTKKLLEPANTHLHI